MAWKEIRTDAKLSELELRAEHVELAAFRSLHERCPPAARRALGLRLVEAGDGWISVAERHPSILLNRTVGLGTLEPLTEERLRRVVDTYGKHGIYRYFLHVHPRTLDDAPERLLSSLGLARARAWRKFRRGMQAVEDAVCSLRVERIGAKHANVFGRIAAEAFGLPPAAAEGIASLVGDPRWHLFMTFDGDTPAGTGGVFVDGSWAWCEYGATAPSFRRRGGQAALMRARIRVALAAGCEHIGTETGEPAPGDPQHSYRNILRCGFEEAELRENWIPAQ